MKNRILIALFIFAPLWSFAGVPYMSNLGGMGTNTYLKTPSIVGGTSSGGNIATTSYVAAAISAISNSLPANVLTNGASAKLTSVTNLSSIGFTNAGTSTLWYEGYQFPFSDALLFGTGQLVSNTWTLGNVLMALHTNGLVELNQLAVYGNLWVTNGSIFTGPTLAGSKAVMKDTGFSGVFSSPGIATNSEKFGAGATFLESIIGYSTVFGANAAASSHGTAMGAGAVASDMNTIAFGAFANASSNGSIALGYGSIASGYSSTVIGDTASAAGYQGIAIGSSVHSTGIQSVSLGVGSSANGNGSTAIGLSANASGAYSTAMGRSSVASAYQSTAVGGGQGVATNSTGIGYFAIAYHKDSTAVGQNSWTSDTNQVMLGTALGTVNIPGTLVAAISASALSSGTVPDARLGTNLVRWTDSRIGFVGDSISAPERGWSTTLLNRYLPDFSGTNVAVSGYTTAQMITQLNGITNWLARTSPQQQRYCWVFGWVNDPGNGIVLSQTISNMATLWGTLTNYGITPIVGTMYNAATDPNPWIRSNYQAYGAILVDMKQLMDASQGMTFDGLHPNDLGGSYIAANIASAMGRNSPVWSSVTAGTNRQYAGSEMPFPLNIGTGGKTNLTLNMDGSTTFVGTIGNSSGGNLTVLNGLTLQSTSTNSLTNGSFTIGTNGWSHDVNSIISTSTNGYAGDCLQITDTRGASADQTYAYTTFPSIIGHNYTVSFYLRSTGSVTAVYIGASVVGTNLQSGLITTTTNWSQYSSNFVATVSSTTITLWQYANSASTSIWYDEVTVKDTTLNSTLVAGKISSDSMISTLGFSSDGVHFTMLLPVLTNQVYGTNIVGRAIYATNAYNGVVIDATTTYQYFSTNASMAVSGFTGVIGQHAFSMTYSNSASTNIIITGLENCHYPTNGISTNVMTIPAGQECVWSWWIRPGRTNAMNILIP